MTAGRSRVMSSWEKRGRPQVIIPQRFGPVRGPGAARDLCSADAQLSDLQLKAVLEYILQMKWYRGQTGTYTGEIGGAGVYGWSRLWQLRRLQRNLRQHREMWQLRQLQA